MKKLEIKTEKATLLVVDLPYPEIWISRTGISFPNGKGGEHFISGNFKHLGKVSEITEEEWKVIVDKNLHTGFYTKYVKFGDPINVGNYQTATQSGLSLLKANGVLLENPDKPYFISKINSEEDRAKSQEQMENYFNELSKVWSNPHVFIKIERGN